MSKMYYAENPDAAHDIHELRVDLLGEKMTFLTDAGVFSKKMVDFGSQLLLKCLDVNQGRASKSFMKSSRKVKISWKLVEI
ncbi:16S RNA G1207 methylase RsmC [Streptococcus pneumoniae]|nr:16S RNA G1207 methylase RsmC [Streptococcus pneumoniae]